MSRPAFAAGASLSSTYSPSLIPEGSWTLVDAALPFTETLIRRYAGSAGRGRLGSLAAAIGPT